MQTCLQLTLSKSLIAVFEFDCDLDVVHFLALYAIGQVGVGNGDIGHVNPGFRRIDNPGLVLVRGLRGLNGGCVVEWLDVDPERSFGRGLGAVADLELEGVVVLAAGQ